MELRPGAGFYPGGAPRGGLSLVPGEGACGSWVTDSRSGVSDLSVI